MIVLGSTSDVLRVVTGQSVTTDVNASWIDLATTATPGVTDTLITNAATTDVVAAPAASTVRVVHEMTIRNRHASSTVDITVTHYNGSNTSEKIKCTLNAGDSLCYETGAGWRVIDSSGRIKMREDTLLPAASTTISTTAISSDVTNNNGSANTIADVTGLSFAVVANNIYWFRFSIPYTAAATTTGSRWCVNGPSLTALIMRSEYSLTTTSRTQNEGVSAYDSPAACNATSAATGSNVAVIEGIIKCSANGTVIARFASEVSSSAIVAKAGAKVDYVQVV